MNWTRFVAPSLVAFTLLGACFGPRKNDSRDKLAPRGDRLTGVADTGALPGSPGRGLVDAADAGPAPESAATASVGKRILLAIGIDEYQELPRLRWAVADATAVADRLEHAGYRVKRLLNRDATRYKIMIALHEHLTTGLGPDDRVLVFYAGHGDSDNSVTPPMGYLVPVDAAQDHVIASGISMGEVQRVLHGLPSKQVMFAADACYSGLALNQIPFTSGGAAGRVRYSLVAGKANEQVSELDGHGVFTKYFLQGIDGSANTDGDQAVRSDELYSYVLTQVQTFVQNKFMRSQVPQFERLGEGEFMFELKPGADGATTDACTGGRVRSPFTSQNCCWIGQGWAGKCVGTPSCPTGTIPKDEDCLIVQTIALMAGETDAAAGYRIGCEGGNARDCSDLGFLAERGAEGVALDRARAKQLQDQACIAGSAVGCRRLAQAYLAEPGVAARAQAIVASQRACDAKDGRGCLLLAHTLVAKPDVAALSQAAKALQQGCEAGQLGAACEALGTMIRTGKTDAVAGQGALAFFSKACSDDGQCGSLAQLYATGDLVTPNPKLAASYTRTACTAGDPEACARFANSLEADASVEHGAETVATLRQRACLGGVKESCAKLKLPLKSKVIVPSQFHGPKGSSVQPIRPDAIQLKNELLRDFVKPTVKPRVKQ